MAGRTADKQTSLHKAPRANIDKRQLDAAENELVPLTVIADVEVACCNACVASPRRASMHLMSVEVRNAGWGSTRTGNKCSLAGQVRETGDDRWLLCLLADGAHGVLLVAPRTCTCTQLFTSQVHACHLLAARTGRLERCDA